MKTMKVNRMTALCVCLAAGTLASTAHGQVISRESVSGTGGSAVQGNGASTQPQLSADAQWIVFRTTATNWPDLSSGGAGVRIIRRNRTTGAVQMINGSGVAASPPLSGEIVMNGGSNRPTFRGAGIAWENDSNQNPSGTFCPDTNDFTDIYFGSGAPQPITSFPAGGCQTQANGASLNPSISPDGTLLAFETAATIFSAGDTSVRDIYTVTTSGNKTFSKKSVTGNILTGITAGNADSFNPSMGGGPSVEQYVTAFESLATNLVSGDTNGARDIFARIDPVSSGGGPVLNFASTERVSVASDGTQANGPSFNPSVSANGRFVVFSSEATNLVPGGTNGVRNIFLRDRTTGTTRRISIAMNGQQPNAACDNPVVSADGTWVAFESTATNLIPQRVTVASRSHVYLCHVPTGTIFNCSYNPATAQEGGGSSNNPTISDDGLTVAFDTLATNLGVSDSNSARDVYTYRRSPTPANDECANAIVLQGGSGSVSGTTHGAFPTVGTPSLLCNSQYSPDVWYSWTPSCGGTATISVTSSVYDTTVAVFSSCDTSALPLACNDDEPSGSSTNSLLTVTVQAGQTYLIRVSGFAGNTGAFQLSYSLPTPANDTFCTATPIGNGSFIFRTCTANLDGPATLSCTGANLTGDVWFRYTAPTGGQIRASTCGNANFDTVLEVFSGNCQSGLGSVIACNDDACGLQSTVVFNALSGQSYLIRVAGFGSSRGQGVLVIGPVSCNAADIAQTDGTPGPDGQNNNGDFQLFIASFFGAMCDSTCGSASPTQCSPADIAQTDSTAGFDGCVDNGDFTLFISAFFSPCQ
jgi:Tol biopolymer transport system component